MRVKILHLTECLGGGVTTAIHSYVANFEVGEHHLFAAARSRDLTGEENKANFASLSIVPRKLSSLARLRRLVRELDPDVIHIHSTVAGLVVRLMPFIERSKVVYTPHGFSFLRNDGRFLRYLYRSAEYVLARRTRFFAACGREEYQIAAGMVGPDRVFELINVCPKLQVIKNSRSPGFHVGMVGRICEQKGVDFFIEVAGRADDCVKFWWIGGGEPTAEKKLRDAGVIVTGWQPREAVIAALAGMDLYFHSAAWDGFPMSVLEAAELGLPLLLRKIKPFSLEGLHTVADAQEAATYINMAAAGKRVPELEDNCSAVKAAHNGPALADALAMLYGAIFCDQRGVPFPEHQNS